MTDLGLHAGLSEALRRWADLIDNVLSRLKTGAPVTGDHAFEELQRLISEVAKNDVSSVDFSDQRVANILALELGKRLNWVELARQLSSPDWHAQAIPMLEALAQCLASEHASTMARMRWGRR
ncbi:MAG: hypothetical protein M3R24_36915 [Chloroflexota bacterium]|nr:hypothetical protein [Chloroflexota bacterium]